MLGIHFVRVFHVPASPRRPRCAMQHSSNLEHSYRHLSINTGLDNYDDTSLNHTSSLPTHGPQVGAHLRVHQRHILAQRPYFFCKTRCIVHYERHSTIQHNTMQHSAVGHVIV